MHNYAKEIMECVKTKVNGKGIDNIEGKDLEELKTWACIVKDIAEYDYYYNVVEAMKNAEEGEDYGEESRRGYRTPRDNRGRYTHRGTPMGYEDMGMPYGGRGYESPERMRDMDRESNGRMYYSDNMSRMYSNNRGYDEVIDAKSLNKLFDELESDMKDMKAKLSPQDMASAKQRLMNLSNMMI